MRMAHNSRMFRRIWIGLRALLAITGAFLLVVTLTPLVPWLGTRLCANWSGVDHGTLIVLSGDTTTLPDTSPSHIIGLGSYWRAVEAIYLWRHGHFEKLLVSGEHTEETIKPLLVANGIPESAIVVEDRARSTRENALYCQPILVGMSGPYVLLTSDYHSYRATRAFAKANVRVETMPAPDLLKRSNRLVSRWQCFWDLAGEFARVAYYRFEGWI